MKVALVAVALSALLILPGTGRAQAEVEILSAHVELLFAIPTERFVENVSLSDSQQRPDLCGSNHFSWDNVSRKVSFLEDGSSTGCGEVGFVFRVPEGATETLVEFDADRVITRTATADQVATNAIQEFRVGDETGKHVATFRLFPRDAKTSPPKPFVIPASSPGSAALNLTWYFEDIGFAPIVGVPSAGSVDALSATISSPNVRVRGVAVAPVNLGVETNVSNGTRTRLATIGLDIPAFPDDRVSTALTFVAPEGAGLSRLVSPRGQSIVPDDLERSVEGDRVSYVVPDALIAAEGAGLWRVEFVTTSLVPPPPPPAAAPVRFYAIPIAAIGVPLVAGAFGVGTSVRVFRKASKRFQATSRALLLAVLLTLGLHLATAAFVFFARRIEAMATLPITTDAGVLLFVFLLFALALFGLWLGAARAASKAMERDVLERAKAEAKFRGLLEAAPDALVIMDPSGRIVLANAQVEKLFGRPRPEIVGGRIDALFPPRFRSDADAGAAFWNAPSSIGGPALELVGLRTDGKEFPAEISLSPIETDEGPLLAAAIRDVTLRKRTERELQRSNAELEHFAYVASHDLQEPLRTIAGFSQLLEQRYGSQLDDKAKSYIQRTVSGSQRMQALINDLLAYSRVQTQAHAFEPVDLTRVVDGVVADLDAVIKKAGATVTRVELPNVHGDATQLAQVFSNLVRNGVKYRHPDRAPIVQISAAREGRAWRLTVRDNGIGIAPEYHEKVFVIFQRLHGREDEGGTGLGLAITKRIVERHGGTIWIESSPGEGSAFHFTIPDPEANE